MKKVAYITADNFIDVDLPLIPFFNCKYDLTWFVIFSKNKTVDYNETFIRKFAKDNNIKTKVYKLKVRFSSFRIIKIWMKLLCAINKTNADIIYIDLFGIPYFFILARLFLHRNKVIYAAHELLVHESVKGIEKYIRKCYLYFILKYFKHYQVFSKNMEKEFIQKYPNKTYYYAPLCLKNYGEKINQIKCSKINFLFFGNIRKNKRLEYLIEAANELHEETKLEFVVTIAGSCKDWFEYEKLIKEPSIFNLKIKTLENEEIIEVFSNAHYLVLPYRIVSQSGPLMVAYNYKIPVIASNIEGFTEFVKDRENGYLFEANNISSLKEIMQYVIENHKNTYSKITNNLCEYVDKELSTEIIVNKYIEYWEKI